MELKVDTKRNQKETPLNEMTETRPNESLITDLNALNSCIETIFQLHQKWTSTIFFKKRKI